MEMLLKAIKFAESAHAGQVRKVSGKPYITHPIEVSYILHKYKVSSKLEELTVAAILHDTLEDCPEVSFSNLSANFSPLVASLVLELTNDKDLIKKLGKREYQKKKLIGLSSWALIIKLADRLQNISDSPSLSYVEDTIEVVSHLMGNRFLSMAQVNLSNEILMKCYKIIGEGENK